MQHQKPSAGSADTAGEGYGGFTAEERAAMKEHAQEVRRAAARRGSRATRAEKAAAAEQEVLAKIAEMPEADRVLAERVHALVRQVAPELAPRLWYGMPAYARDGKVVCHFQGAGKFKTRYATLGFSDQAALDDGALWPVAYALKELTETEERFLTELLARAVA
ncbi:iron chaperone [Streptomyces fradiae]|uniref:iron chaperone n=1 Tax=Streptomyces fradiae TaxID=1906 RepID=UPI0035BE8A00